MSWWAGREKKKEKKKDSNLLKLYKCWGTSGVSNLKRSSGRNQKAEGENRLKQPNMKRENLVWSVCLCCAVHQIQMNKHNDCKKQQKEAEVLKLKPLWKEISYLAKCNVSDNTLGPAFPQDFAFLWKNMDHWRCTEVKRSTNNEGYINKPPSVTGKLLCKVIHHPFTLHDQPLWWLLTQTWS